MDEQFRVVETANPLVSPFPDHTWQTREQAEKFANEDAPNGWAGKLTVVPPETAESMCRCCGKTVKAAPGNPCEREA